MEKKILILIIVIWTWVATATLIYFGIKFNDKIDNLDAKISGLQQQILESKQQPDVIKSKADTQTIVPVVVEETQQAESKLVAESKARDARRLSDMRQLVSAQEMYYGGHDKYLTSTTFPNAIGTNLTITPRDPGNYTYSIVSNASDTTKFCYYAKLENPNTTANGCTTKKPCGYYTASEGGNFYKTMVPTTLGSGSNTGCAIQK